MNQLVAVALGALSGLGILLIVNGLSGRELLPRGLSSPGRTSVGNGPLRAASPNRLIWMVGALFVVAAIYLMTGWWVAALVVGVLVTRVPAWRSMQQNETYHIRRTQAVASWTEMIRDNMAGAAGLEQALQVSARLAPNPIAPELNTFGRRLESDRLDRALIALGEDLSNPAADLVVAALLNATRMEVRDLGPLLSRLAEATRAEVRMRQRVEVGRAKIRTSARIVVATTALTIVFLTVFSRQILSVYDTFSGQLWMVVVISVFLFGGWLLRHYGRLEMPARFVPRSRDTTGLRYEDGRSVRVAP